MMISRHKSVVNPIDLRGLREPRFTIDSRGRRHVTSPPERRLKANVPTWGAVDACWVWIGVTNRKGYGWMVVEGRRILVHRISYALHHGVDPGLLRVLHRCDNPPCVNSAHLFLGTAADNTADMIRKGRGVAPVNEANGRTKLTKQQVQEIRARAATGESYGSLARDYPVHKVTIGNIATYRRRVS